MREVGAVDSWRRVRGRWLILKKLLLVRMSSFLFSPSETGLCENRQCSFVSNTWGFVDCIRYTKHCTCLVIVRRVVAARQHAAGKAAVPPRGNQGFHSHAQSASRTQPLPAYGEKEADSADFPERPGAKMTKRGGFWARFKCW